MQANLFLQFTYWLIQLDLRRTQHGSPPDIADVPPPARPHISLMPSVSSSLYTLARASLGTHSGSPETLPTLFLLSS